MIKTACFYFLLLFYALGVSAQKNSLSDSIYNPNIKTVLFQGRDAEEPYPKIRLGSDDMLELHFDELGTEAKNYQFTVVHCNYNWKPSGLLPNQYIDGLNSDFINVYNNSFNTYINYIHYENSFPNFNMKPIISGNYLLKVYEDGDEEKLVLTKRFYVVDYSAKIDAVLRRATLARHMYTSHEIDFNVNISALQSFIPRNDFRVTLRQNNRWDNAKYNIEPQFVLEKELQYNYEEENVFKAFNEFRVFDTRNVRFGGQSLYKNYLSDSSVYHAVLYAEKDRSELPHRYYIDLNGHYIIQNLDGQNDDLESDYVWVHFYMLSTYEMEQDVYVFGALSNWKLKPEFKMEYNKEKHWYHTKVLLKQGFYNYVFAAEKNGKPDLEELEGSYYETENDYEIIVYQRSMVLNADVIVGYKLINSLRGEKDEE
ncbi:MAG: DUF5103 domain-containing protein [Bacteroidetes bacterium]|nr:DUF5103 domain-containing protein [Bacteroidota bacterium]